MLRFLAGIIVIGAAIAILFLIAWPIGLLANSISDSFLFEAETFIDYVGGGIFCLAILAAAILGSLLIWGAGDAIISDIKDIWPQVFTK